MYSSVQSAARAGCVERLTRRFPTGTAAPSRNSGGPGRCHWGRSFIEPPTGSGSTRVALQATEATETDTVTPGSLPVAARVETPTSSPDNPDSPEVGAVGLWPPPSIKPPLTTHDLIHPQAPSRQDTDCPNGGPGPCSSAPPSTLRYYTQARSESSALGTVNSTQTEAQCTLPSAATRQPKETRRGL